MFKKKKKIQKQTTSDFLKGCGIPEGTLEAMFAIKIRKLLASCAGPYTQIKKADHVFDHYKIENELGIEHIASMDLVEIVLELEREGISISEAEGERIFKLNKRNATVAEIVNELINISKEKYNKTDSG